MSVREPETSTLTRSTRTWPCATARVAKKATVDTWPPSRRNLTSGWQPDLYYQTKKDRYSIRSLLVKKKEKKSCSQQSIVEQVDVKCAPQECSSDSEMSEGESASSSPLTRFNPSSIVKEENMISNKEVVSVIRNEFSRIADLLERSSPSCSCALSQFCKLLSDVRTPAQAHHLVANNVRHISCSADDV